jgi:hypothetical protein
MRACTNSSGVLSVIDRQNPMLLMVLLLLQ